MLCWPDCGADPLPVIHTSFVTSVIHSHNLGLLFYKLVRWQHPTYKSKWTVTLPLWIVITARREKEMSGFCYWVQKVIYKKINVLLSRPCAIFSLFPVIIHSILLQIFRTLYSTTYVNIKPLYYPMFQWKVKKKITITLSFYRSGYFHFNDFTTKANFGIRRR